MLTLAADLDVAAGFNDGRLEEPREAEADEDVEDVAPDRVGHRHVAVALPETQVGELIRLAAGMSRKKLYLGGIEILKWLHLLVWG